MALELLFPLEWASLFCNQIKCVCASGMHKITASHAYVHEPM